MNPKPHLWLRSGPRASFHRYDRVENGELNELAEYSARSKCGRAGIPLNRGMQQNYNDPSIHPMSCKLCLRRRT